MSKKTIHNVHVLDASGSMVGAKYNNALEGINAEMEQMKDNKEVQYTQTVYEFDSVKHGEERITEHYFMEPIQSCKAVKGVGASGNTPLYQTVGYVLEKLVRKVRNGDAVVVTIFTDGAHNCNWGKYAQEKTLNELINDLQESHNFTITFMGTKEDTKEVIKKLGLFESNTLVHDNTAKGISHAYMMRSNSLESYTASGASASDSFFINNQKI